MRKARTTEVRSDARDGNWTEEQGRAALADLKASGDSVAAFARRTGITRQRIYYWTKRAASVRTRAQAREDEPNFVAVRLPCSRANAQSAWIELDVAGTVVRIRESLDAEHVGRLVEAIARRLEGRC